MMSEKLLKQTFRRQSVQKLITMQYQNNDRKKYKAEQSRKISEYQTAECRVALYLCQFQTY